MSTFVTRLSEADASENVVLSMTHAADNGGCSDGRRYFHYSWKKLCAAVLLLDVDACRDAKAFEPVFAAEVTR